MTYNATLLEHPSHLVRFMNPDGVTYDRMIVVTEQDEGRALLLQGWIDKEQRLTRREWRAARDALFPKARVVRYWRAGASGLRAHRLDLAPPLPRAGLAALVLAIAGWLPVWWGM